MNVQSLSTQPLSQEEFGGTDADEFNFIEFSTQGSEYGFEEYTDPSQPISQPYYDSQPISQTDVNLNLSQNLNSLTFQEPFDLVSDARAKELPPHACR